MSSFKGFPYPNFTAVPDLFFDFFLHELGGSECKVANYLMRRTFGFGREKNSISLQQISTGLKRADGTPLDHGTGLSISTVQRALERLEELGIVVKEPQTDERGQAANIYSLRFEVPHPPLVMGDQGGSQEQTGALVMGDHPPCSPVTTPLSHGRPPLYKERNTERETEERNTERETENHPQPLLSEEVSEEEETYTEPNNEPSEDPHKTVDINLKTVQGMWSREAKQQLKLRNKPQAALLKRVYAIAGAWGGEEFLEREEQYLKAGGRSFTDFLDNFQNIRRSSKKSRPATIASPPVSPDPPTQQSAPEAPIPGESLNDKIKRLAEEWNAKVPGRPWEVWDSSLDLAMHEKLAEKGFEEKYPKLLEKCNEIAKAKHPRGGFFGIEWVLKNNNWVKILNGAHDWLLYDERKGPSDEDRNPALRLLAKRQAERAARGDAQANGTL